MRDILHIRPAVTDDIETIISMIDEAAAWLGTKGIDQWATPWPTEAARNARVLRGITGGGTWMVEDDGYPVGTITYRQKGNQKLWTAGELCDPAVYVSRLIVSRKYMGNQIGAALIDWAGYQAWKAWKAQWIRVDVWTTNIALHNYYKKQRFAPIRICEFNNPYSYPSAALFQKPIAEIDPRAADQFTIVNGSSPGPGMAALQTCP